MHLFPKDDWKQMQSTCQKSHPKSQMALAQAELHETKRPLKKKHKVGLIILVSRLGGVYVRSPRPYQSCYATYCTVRILRVRDSPYP